MQTEDEAERTLNTARQRPPILGEDCYTANLNELFCDYTIVAIVLSIG